MVRTGTHVWNQTGGLLCCSISDFDSSQSLSQQHLSCDAEEGDMVSCLKELFKVDIHVAFRKIITGD